MSEFISPDSNLEKEITVLEKRLAEKRAEFNQAAFSKDDLKSAIKERMTERFEPKIAPRVSVSSNTTGGSKTITPIISDGKVSVGKLKSASKDEQLQILVGVALSRSIPEAVDLVEKLESPYLLDELHDLLVDKFYDVLVKRGKI